MMVMDVVHVLTNGISVSLVFLQKSTVGKSVTFKTKLKKTISREFPDYSGYFECHTYRVTLTAILLAPYIWATLPQAHNNLACMYLN